MPLIINFCLCKSSDKYNNVCLHKYILFIICNSTLCKKSFLAKVKF